MPNAKVSINDRLDELAFDEGECFWKVGDCSAKSSALGLGHSFGGCRAGMRTFRHLMFR